MKKPLKGAFVSCGGRIELLFQYSYKIHSIICQSRVFAPFRKVAISINIPIIATLFQKMGTKWEHDYFDGSNIK